MLHSRRAKLMAMAFLSLQLAITGIPFLPAALHAQEKHVPKATDWAEKTLRGWMKESVVIDAVKAQNTRHAGITQADIDALDKQWRAETKAAAKPLINQVMGNALSAHLRKLEAGTKGLVTEIFVMDNKGLNVGQSDVTTDYWQADEAKWQKTFLVGPGAIFVDKVEKDESTQKFQVQVSISIIDPSTNAAIGAVTVGLDIETLMDI